MTRALSLGGDGLRVAVKECIGIEGLVTRCGSPAFAGDAPQAAHAAVVEALIASDCAIVGTANMHELAFGVTGINSYLGTPVNPRWPERIPGGSSSGPAVLVAAGRCDFTVGTDTGGSVRMPACCCGVFGMKPTFGRIDRRGAIPAQSSLDCIGPFAASAEMLTRAMECMDQGFARQASEGPFLLARLEVEAAPEIAAAFEAAVGPLVEGSVRLKNFEAAYEAGLVVINAELGAAFGDRARRAEDMDPGVRARVLAAVETFSQDALARAEETRTLFANEVDRALEGVDALVLPTMPVVPPTLAEAGDMRALIPLTALVRPFNLSGHPAITLPILTADGLPAGIQIVGRRGEDARLCAVAEWLAGPASEAGPQIVGENDQ